jgi:hypothetical protein
VVSAVLTGMGWPAAVVWVFWVAGLKDAKLLLFGAFSQPDLSVPVVILAVGAYAVVALVLFRLADERTLFGVEIGLSALGAIGVATLVAYQFFTIIGKAMGAALGCAFGCKSASPGFHGEPAAVGTGSLLLVWFLLTLTWWIIALVDVRKRSSRR